MIRNQSEENMPKKKFRISLYMSITIKYKDSSAKWVSLMNGKLGNEYWVIIGSIAPIEIYNVIYNGKKLELIGQFTNFSFVDGIAYIPASFNEISRIVHWCGKHREATNDLFSKYGVDYVESEEDKITDLSICDDYEKYVLLADELIRNSEFVY